MPSPMLIDREIHPRPVVTPAKITSKWSSDSGFAIDRGVAKGRAASTLGASTLASKRTTETTPRAYQPELHFAGFTAFAGVVNTFPAPPTSPANHTVLRSADSATLGLLN